MDRHRYTRADAEQLLLSLRAHADLTCQQADRLMAESKMVSSACRARVLREMAVATLSRADLTIRHAAWIESKLRDDCPHCHVMHITVGDRLRCDQQRRRH